MKNKSIARLRALYSYVNEKAYKALLIAQSPQTSPLNEKLAREVFNYNSATAVRIANQIERRIKQGFGPYELPTIEGRVKHV